MCELGYLSVRSSRSCLLTGALLIMFYLEENTFCLPLLFHGEFLKGIREIRK